MIELLHTLSGGIVFFLAIYMVLSNEVSKFIWGLAAVLFFISSITYPNLEIFTFVDIIAWAFCNYKYLTSE